MGGPGSWSSGEDVSADVCHDRRALDAESLGKLLGRRAGAARFDELFDLLPVGAGFSVVRLWPGGSLVSVPAKSVASGKEPVGAGNSVVSL